MPLERNTNETPSGSNERPSGNGALSPREMEVLSLIREGLSSRQAAERLFISKRTVDFHLANAYERLGVSSRMQAMKVMQTQSVSVIWYGRTVGQRMLCESVPSEDSYLEAQRRAEIEACVTRIEGLLARTEVQCNRLKLLLRTYEENVALESSK